MVRTSDEFLQIDLTVQYAMDFCASRASALSGLTPFARHCRALQATDFRFAHIPVQAWERLWYVERSSHS